jgi:hypothetical protein
MLSVVGLQHLLSCVQRSTIYIAFHVANGIWAAALPIKFEIVPAPVQNIYYFFFGAYIAWRNLPRKDEQSILFYFDENPRFSAQDRADQGLVDRELQIEYVLK